MKDYTLAVNELRTHYNELSVYKKSVKAQVKAEYEAKMDFEIQSRIEAEEIKFANHVAAVKERENLPVTVIQDHVLRTRTWSRWERIRDLAGIPGEFVRAEDAREAKRRENAVFLWSDDYSTLTVQKDVDGVAFAAPMTYDVTTNAKHGTIWWPDALDRDADMALRQGPRGIEYARAVSDEIQRAIDSGHVAG